MSGHPALPSREDRRGSPIKKVWPRGLIIDAIQRWVATHGELPKSDEWSRVTDESPAHMTVVREFGSWNAAITAAGFCPRSAGGQSKRTS